VEKTDDLKTKRISEEGVAVVREGFNRGNNIQVPKLMGICIHHGFNSEKYDFALMLKYWHELNKPLVIYNCWEGHDQGIGKFKEVSQANIMGMDIGWRPSNGGRRLTERLGSSAKIILSWQPMLKLAKSYHPNVIYSSQQTWDNLTAWYLSRRLSIPQIIHLHYMPALGGPLICKFAERRLKHCDHVIAVYIRDAAVEYGVDSRKVSVLWNTREMPAPPSLDIHIKVREELGIPLNAVVAGIVARLVPWKGQKDTIEAFARIARQFPDAYLVIVGGGEYRDELERTAQATGFSNRIIFTGLRSDISNILSALDIFVHPSRMEAFGIAVLEASSHGLPVIAYEEGGIKEIVVNGMTGYLTPPGDINSLSHKMSCLITNSSLRRAMGQSGRERADKLFTPKYAGISFYGILLKVLNTNKIKI
jgi:glycosyltransferase involved in cell wall biosynthesis